jgi:hypothetical protein
MDSIARFEQKRQKNAALTAYFVNSHPLVDKNVSLFCQLVVLTMGLLQLT